MQARFSKLSQFSLPAMLFVKLLSISKMHEIGGGWNLAVTINSAKNDHLQSAEMNCLNSKLCVPFTENDIAARKLTDKYIHELLHFEG